MFRSERKTFPGAALAAAIFFVLVTGVAMAGAAHLDVCQSGGATYTSIQAAVDGASDGGVIDVCAGIHTEAGIVIDGKLLTVVGQGQAVTIVQAAASFDTATDRVFKVVNVGALDLAEDGVILRDLTLRHGVASADGGVDRFGGGLAVFDATATLEDTTIPTGPRVSNTAPTALYGRRAERRFSPWPPTLVQRRWPTI